MIVISRIYLIRQIARRFGINALKSISELSVLNWVIPEETRGDQVSTKLSSLAMFNFLYVMLFLPIAMCIGKIY